MRKATGILSLLLALVLCVSLLPLSALAVEDVTDVEDEEITDVAEAPVPDASDEPVVEVADDADETPVTDGATYSGTCGENVTWTLNTSTGKLTISGTGAMTNYSYSTSAPWYSYQTSIKTATIQSGVTTIGNCAFHHCTSLTSVTIPNSVTSISEEAFYGCESLTSVNVSAGNTQYVSRDGVLFNKSMTELICCPGGRTGVYTIPDSVTSIDNYAFSGCTSLTSVTIPNSVTSIGEEAFSYCKSLTSVTIPTSVTSIGDYAFWFCATLTSVNIPANVTSIGEGAFSGCYSLTSMNVSVRNTQYAAQNSVLFNKTMTELLCCPGGRAGEYTIPDSVISIGIAAFAFCTNLTNVTIPNSVTSIGDRAFFYCKNLTSVTIPASVTSISSGAFWFCTALTSVNIPAIVTFIGDRAFYGCESLTSVNVSAGNTQYVSRDGVLFNKSITELICCPGGRTGVYTIPDSVTSIDNYAFGGCTSLTSVTIPDSVTTIDIGAFWLCESLTDVYYAGSKADWAAITIGPFNDELLNATIHYNYAAPSASPFTDVSSTVSYYKYVMWAYNNGIVKGTSATTFSPNADCTRGQFALMLYRLAGKPDVTGLTNPFKDVKKSDPYYKAILWAYNEGVIKGTSATTFNPSGSVTRGQIVLMLYRMAGKPTVANTTNPFTDVSKSDSCYKAVLWAVEQGITKGTSATTFSPNANCTRYQLVTFLYRFNDLMKYI